VLSAEGLQNLRKRTKNTIEVCLHLSLDKDLHDQTCVIAETFTPISREHGQDLKRMVTVDACLQKYVYYATFGWLDTMHAVVDTLSDVEVLRKCGFTAERSPSVLRGLDTSSPQVIMENGLAEIQIDLVICTLKHRSRSLLHYSLVYPACLAVVHSHLPHVVEEGFDALKASIAEFEEAAMQTSSLVKQMVKRSSMNSPIMEVIRRLVKLGVNAFALITAYCKDVFEGWGQSVMNERLNKEIRDHETRDQASLTMKRMKRWAIARQYGESARWGRDEVGAPNIMQAQPPSDLFAPTQATKKKRKAQE
jgi:hypothetical protein